MPYCAAYGCRTQLKKGSGIHFFGFPKEIERRRQWVHYCEREDFVEATLYSTLCSKHFSPAQYARDPKRMARFGYTNARPSLKAEALPDVPLDLEKPLGKLKAKAIKRKSNKRGRGKVQENQEESANQIQERTIFMNNNFRVSHLDLPCTCISAEFYVDVNTFHSFLKQKHTETDKAPVPKRKDLRSEVLTYEDGVRKVGKQISMTITALLRYAFVHCDDFEICRLLTADVKTSLRMQIYRKIRAREPREPLITEKTSEDKTSMNTQDNKPHSEDKQTSLRSELPQFEVGQSRNELQCVDESIGGRQNHSITSISETVKQKDANDPLPGYPELIPRTDTKHESERMDCSETLPTLQNEKEKSCSTKDVQSTVTEQNSVFRNETSLPRPLFLQKLYSDIPHSEKPNPTFVTQSFSNRPGSQIGTSCSDQNDSPFRISQILNGNKTSSYGLEPTNANNRNSHEAILPETLSIKLEHEMDEDTVSCGLEPTNANNRNPHVDIRPETFSIKIEHGMDKDTMSNKMLILENRNPNTNGNGSSFANTRHKRLDPVLDDVAVLRSSYHQEQLSSHFEARPMDPVTIESGPLSENVICRKMTAQQSSNKDIMCPESVIKPEVSCHSDDDPFSKIRDASMHTIDNIATQHFSSDYIRKLNQFTLGQFQNDHS